MLKKQRDSTGKKKSNQRKCNLSYWENNHFVELVFRIGQVVSFVGITESC